MVNSITIQNTASLLSAPASTTNAPVATAESNATDTNPFGPATLLDLSSDAQSTISIPATSADQSGNISTSPAGGAAGTSDSRSTAAATPPSGGAPPAGGAAGTSSSSLSSEVLAAKQKVAAQVGVAAANELVDKQGNIDRIGLAQEIARQQQAKAASA